MIEKVRNSVGDNALESANGSAAAHEVTLWDATLARTSQTPNAWPTIAGADWVIHWRIAGPFKSLHEIGDVLPVAILSTHVTAGKSSQTMTHVALVSLVPRRVSKTISRRSTPAISKSELVTVPLGLSCNTRLLVVSLGHVMRQTMGAKSFLLPNHAPHAPNPLASQ